MKEAPVRNILLNQLVWIKTYTHCHFQGSFSVGKLDKPTATISVSDDDFCALAEGKLNPQTAFMQGKIKLKGSMALVSFLIQNFIYWYWFTLNVM